MKMKSKIKGGNLMEEKLLKIFKLADSLNEKQDKVYAQITYTADNTKTIELVIRSKENYAYVERREFKLYNNSLVKWDNLIEMFESYVEN